MHVIRSLTHTTSQPILQLRSLNPHVASLLEDGDARPNSIARHAAASVGRADSRSAAAVGISAFAYQGVKTYASLQALRSV